MKIILLVGLFVAFYAATKEYFNGELLHALFFLGLAGLFAVIRLTLVMEEKR